MQNRWYAWHMRLDRNPRRHATAERRPSHKETTTKRSYAYGLRYCRGSNKESPPDDSSSYPCTLLPPLLHSALCNEHGGRSLDFEMPDVASRRRRVYSTRSAGSTYQRERANNISIEIETR